MSQQGRVFAHLNREVAKSNGRIARAIRIHPTDWDQLRDELRSAGFLLLTGDGGVDLLRGIPVIQDETRVDGPTIDWSEKPWRQELDEAVELIQRLGGSSA